jgi:S-methylmethionine-dependent homocysteine/selenocysteine methylase
MITLLDGPLGTELDARNVKIELPHWSGAAIHAAPDVIADIHRDYAAAGATVHTANTFRTKRRTVGTHWRSWTQRAVEIARGAVPAGHRIAGSLAPLEDCYRPDLSPTDAEVEHREFAAALAAAGCDMVLCETFPHVGEALAAVRASVLCGIETWVSFTAGPNADLMTAAEMAQGAKQAVDAGAAAVLVNCTPAIDTIRFVVALDHARLGVPIGAYANAGNANDPIGWNMSTERSVNAYIDLAKQWIDAGASLIGGCCGTRPAHIAGLRTLKLRTLK